MAGLVPAPPARPVTPPDHAAHAGPPVWVPLVLLAVVALLVEGYLFAAAADRRGWSRWRTGAWLSGCLVAAVAVASAAQAAADARVHMAQHVLLGMIAPVGLVLGAPVTLALRAGSRRVRRTVGRLAGSRPVHVLGHPVTAALLTVGGSYVVMLTPVHALSMQHPGLYLAVSVHYLAAGYLFAWAVAGPDPAPRRPGLAWRTATLVVAGAAHAVLAKHLYAHAGAGGGDEAVLRAAAQWMYYGGDLSELLLALALFAGWYRRRRRSAPRTTVTGRGGHTVAGWRPAPDGGTAR